MISGFQNLLWNGSTGGRYNPGGTLNHKYAAEWAVRKASVPYAIVRPTGLLAAPEQPPSSPPPPAKPSSSEVDGEGEGEGEGDGDGDGDGDGGGGAGGSGGGGGSGDVASAAAEVPAATRLEVGQGDAITGRVRRDELAAVVAAVGRCKLNYVDPLLESDWFQTLTLEHHSWFQNVPFKFNLCHYTAALEEPAACGVTFELRRAEQSPQLAPAGGAPSSLEPGPTSPPPPREDLRQLLRSLRADPYRGQAGTYS